MYRNYCFLLPLFFLASVFLHTTSNAEHLRLYACALASDDPTAFMGGSSIGAGLWISDDTAKTWTQIGWKHVKCYSVDVVDSSNGKIIYLACGNGLMRSLDAGDHWRMLTDWRISEVLDVAIDQSHPNTIGIATSTGLWQTNDEGVHWKEVGEREYQSHLYFSPKYDAILPYNADTMGASLLELDGQGSVLFNSSTIVHHNKRRGALWCIGHYDSTIVLGGERGLFVVDTSNVPHKIADAPRNIHSIVNIGKELLLASLSGGVWKYNQTAFTPSVLDSLQVCKVKGAIIK
jgi:hypothetical protein